MEEESSVIPQQFAQFFNDVVVVTYNDGSTLQLSPCGNQFVHLAPPKAKNLTLSGVLRVQQKSEFATSAFRDKVREALQFRNMFASRPFVCHLLMENVTEVEKIEPGEPGAPVEWPDDPTQVGLALNGRLTIQAVQPSSCVVHLSSNRQEFRSEYAVRLPSSRQREGSVFSCVRITEHHSVREVPQCWRPAVNLVLRSIGIPPDEDDSEVTPAQLCLPEPLPLRCPRQHLHRFERAGPSGDPVAADEGSLGWLVCAEGRRMVKALCLEGILYRLHPPPHLAVEIFPGDGTILVSNNLTGCFFTHFIPAALVAELGSAKDEVVERVYSTTTPPPSFAKGLDYDLARVLRHGRTLCEYLAECLTMLGVVDSLSMPADCCWRATDEEEALELELGLTRGRLSSRSGSARSGSDLRELKEMKEAELEPSRGPRSSQNGVARSSTEPERSSSAASHSTEGRRSERSVAEERQSARRERRTSRSSDEAALGRRKEKEREDGEEDVLTPRRLLEKHEVADVGTFTAAASGRIHILFRDRVSLDMRADLSRRLALDGRRPPPSRLDPCPDLPPAGYARIFTKNGRFEVVQVHFPEPFFERYINSALEWVEWVNCSPEERARFYTERPEPPSPASELKKIECFNYIMENSSDKYAGASNHAANMNDPYDYSYSSRTHQIKSIEDTLAKTSQFLKDLDNLKAKRKL